MKPDIRCELLAKKIIEIFQNGLILSNDVLHYIDSTFANPSPKELEDLINDEDNCEKDSLLELIFFPNESLKAHLEALLESHGYQTEDEEKVLDYLFLKSLPITIHFPDNRGRLKLDMPWPAGQQFISRLKIARQLDPRCAEALRRHVASSLLDIVKVKLRHTRLVYAGNKITFMRSFFESIKSDREDFMECLDFILAFFDELQDDNDIFQALMDKKGFYFTALQKAISIEKQLQQNNIETLLQQRISVPGTNQAEMRTKMKIIDKICLSVFGLTNHFELFQQNINLGQDRKKENIEKVTKIFT